MAVPKNCNPRRVNVDGLAEYLSVSPWWVRRAVQEERIPYQHVGRHLRFDLDKIDAWLAESSYEPAKPAARATKRKAGR